MKTPHTKVVVLAICLASIVILIISSVSFVAANVWLWNTDQCSGI